jgi:hypothetical protein
MKKLVATAALALFITSPAIAKDLTPRQASVPSCEEVAHTLIDVVVAFLFGWQAGDRVGASSSASHPRGTNGSYEQIFGAE